MEDRGANDHEYGRGAHQTGEETAGKGNLPKLQVLFGKLQLVVRKRFWQLSQAVELPFVESYRGVLDVIRM